MRKERPSTYDVARLAHVSVSTVSRVINGHAGVDQATRSAVWRAIRELGYEVVRKPDVLSGVLVLAPSVSFASTYWQLAVSGILDEASHHALPVLFSAGEDRERALAQLRAFAQRDGIVGVILACFPMEVRAEDWLPGDLDVAVVSMLMLGTGNRVNITMYDAVRKVTLRLLQLGHRRIALAINSLAWWAQRQRLLGYLDAFREMGLEPPDPALYRSVPNNAVKSWVEAWLADPDPPTAIIGGTSELSRQVYAELHRLRVRIPGDLSFVGIGHERKWEQPLFDMISQPTFDLGVEAVRALRRVVMRPDQTVVTELHPRLLHAGTVAAPPARAASAENEGALGEFA